MSSTKQASIFNIETDTLNNNNFRKVIYTNDHSQLVFMSLLPGEDIGMEIHNVDQFIRIEKGKGRVNINNYIYDVSDNDVINIPSGNYHNLINIGHEKLKLYTIYSPPNEPKNLIQLFKPN